MRKSLRFLPAAAVLSLPFLTLVCAPGNPTSPFAGFTPQAPGRSGTATAQARLTASRFDLSADGIDSVVVTVTATDANGNPIVGAQVSWSIQTQNFSGQGGKMSQSATLTNTSGQSSAGYVAPLLEFVPVGAIVIVSATVNIPGNPQGSPRGSVTFLLRPKGSAPTSGTGGTGELLPPTISAITPTEIRVDQSPPVTVVIQGTGFDQSSQVLIVTSKGLVTVSPQFFSSEQIRFQPPASLSTQSGDATIFVTGPGNLLSAGFPIVLSTQSVTGLPTISALLPAQGPVGSTPTRVIVLGSGFGVSGCPGNGAGVTFASDFLQPPRTVCPIGTATENRLVIDAPTSATNSGPASVFVTNADGTVSNTVTFTYTATNVNGPQISSLSPSSGPTTGGYRVLVLGGNFTATDSVIIASPTIFSPATDVCTDGAPLCSANQCVLNAARGTCTVNGVAGITPFVFQGSGQIEIVMPNVGTSAAGTADVLVRNVGGDASAAAVFTFVPPSELFKPVILGQSVTSFRGDGCCPQGTWGILLVGQNFRKCSSIIVTTLGSHIYELLPTPDIADCNIKRGSTAAESPRERLLRLLPPDGETIRCGGRPDLIAFRQVGPTSYMHDLICDYFSSAPIPFDTVHVGDMIPAPPEPNDVTSGGAFSWINESEIRLFYGPPVDLGCESSHEMNIYVSNDPGRGLSGDFISDPVKVVFTNTTECVTPAPLAITSTAPAVGTCDGIDRTPPPPDTPLGFTIVGTGFDLGAVTVQFGPGNFATGLAVTPTVITGTVPAATSSVCPVYTCTGTPCGAPFICTVDVIVTAGASTVTKSAGFTYQSSLATPCTP